MAGILTKRRSAYNESNYRWERSVERESTDRDQRFDCLNSTDVKCLANEGRAAQREVIKSYSAAPFENDERRRCVRRPLLTHRFSGITGLLLLSFPLAGHLTSEVEIAVELAVLEHRGHCNCPVRCLKAEAELVRAERALAERSRALRRV